MKTEPLKIIVSGDAADRLREEHTLSDTSYSDIILEALNSRTNTKARITLSFDELYRTVLLHYKNNASSAHVVHLMRDFLLRAITSDTNLQDALDILYKYNTEHTARSRRDDDEKVK